MLVEIDNKLEIKTDQTRFTHKNYLEYLEICWANHFGAVISPDIIWHILMCELAVDVKKNPEIYRSMFTNSAEKKEISVAGSDPFNFPIEKVIEILKGKCNVDIKDFLPQFSTTGEMERLAFAATFCDLVSPFYSYSMYCCGIPKVKIEGTPEDYGKIAANLTKIYSYLSQTGVISGRLMIWMTNVVQLCKDIASTLENQKVLVFGDMFKLKRCGSGSQVEVEGWITTLFIDVPPVRFVRNYNSCLSVVKFKDLSTKLNYELKVGLCDSSVKDGLLIPVFTRITTQV